MTMCASLTLKPAAMKLLILATLLPVLAQAQYMAAPTLPMPFGECVFAQWTSNRNIDDRANITNAGCTLNWKPKLSDNIRLGFNARAGWHDQAQASNANQRVREAYLDYDIEPFSLRVGRQIIAWGRADRINPTDSLSPRDFTLLGLDDEQQRNGIDAIRLNYAVNPTLSLSAIVAKSAINITPRGLLPPNLVEATLPRETEWALKLDHAGGKIDWSLSYFDGLSRARRYLLDFADPRKPIFRSDVERVQKIGADFASAHGAWTFRGEVAHARISRGEVAYARISRGEVAYARIGSTCTSCSASSRRVTSAVIGGDIDFASTANFNMQLFANLKNNFTDPTSLTGLQQVLVSGLNRLNTDYAARETGITMRLSERLLNDKLRLEISTVVDLNQHSYALRPRLTYAVNDHLTLTAGIDRFKGQTQSFFGALSKNNTAAFILNWIF